MKMRSSVAFVLLVIVAPLMSGTMQTAATQSQPAALQSTPRALADASNVTVVSHMGGITKAVSVHEGHAYIGEGPALTILNLSSPASPGLVGKTSPLPGIVLDVDVSGDYAYVHYGHVRSSGLAIVDVTEKAQPQVVGVYEADYPPNSDWWAGWEWGVAAVGNYVYVAAGVSGLWGERVLFHRRECHPGRFRRILCLCSR